MVGDGRGTGEPLSFALLATGVGFLSPECSTPTAHFMDTPFRRRGVLPWLSAIFFAALTTAVESADPPLDWRVRAVERARILSQVKWAPVADTMPNRKGGYFEKGKLYTGVPYSSVRSEGRYIGFDIGLPTFLAAVENPLSVLYTENLTGRVSNAAAFYGAVCSSYTSYALGCGIWEVSRRHGPEFSEGVILVDPASAEGAEIGDIIYTPPAKANSGSHVEMVTAVTRDDQGRVISVRVEESRPPTTQTTDRGAAEFDAHLAARNKQLLRVSDPDLWRGDNLAERHRYPDYERDAGSAAINRTLLLDLGDWVPYLKGDPVKFHVMDRDRLGVKSLVIHRGEVLVEEIPLDGPGEHRRVFADCGDYTARVVHRDGSLSQACEFAVCDLDLRLPENSVALGAEWELGFGAENMEVTTVYLWNSGDSYGRHPLFPGEEQRKDGAMIIPSGLLKKPGTLQVWLIGEHRLGRLKVRKDIPLARP